MKKKDRAYLFRVKKARLPLTKQNLNDIYGHLSAEELLIKYYSQQPKPIKEDSEGLTKMFKSFD